MKYKIDNIPVKEFEIKFIATLENGETIDLSKLLLITPFLDLTMMPSWFKNHLGNLVTCCEMFDKDGNLPLSEIDDYAELHRDD
tara:strand:+ start:65 stop:316 length:252 start_codon:yes stop_codon:yes gene_type:complete